MLTAASIQVMLGGTGAGGGPFLLGRSDAWAAPANMASDSAAAVAGRRIRSRTISSSVKRQKPRANCRVSAPIRPMEPDSQQDELFGILHRKIAEAACRAASALSK